jgi:glycine dehydrogenase
MKLNATAEMLPVTWPEFANIHPFAPADQTIGYQMLIDQLESMLSEITGYDGISLQPNAGSQGEYAGLLAIKSYHESRGDHHRDICLIPSSAHGTNPASAQMCGMKVVVVACDDQGNVDIDDLKQKAEQHRDNLSAIMVTYPSTHGVFEENITELCDIVHQHGGQVYIDGANLNAMVGVCQPGKFGGDVSHLNLHKTFCIPHGGGGPGVGPVCVGEHLAEFLPQDNSATRRGGRISAAPFGSASILPITWMYIRMMGYSGLRQATEVAILNANYIAKRLESKYSILFTGANDRVAHECIVDTRDIKEQTGVSVDDIAKRLIDYGFHAPTMSFPVAGTLMIEPTESESKREIDRFCDAMLSIADEVAEVADGKYSLEDNPLAGAPHTAAVATSDDWQHSYSRSTAIYPSELSRANKYWPPVGRLDNVFGDRNLVCSCPSIKDYQ